MATDEKRETYSVEQFAEVMGISTASAYRLVKRGAVPSFRLGQLIKIPKPWVAGLLAGEHELRESAGV